MQPLSVLWLAAASVAAICAGAANGEVSLLLAGLLAATLPGIIRVRHPEAEAMPGITLPLSALPLSALPRSGLPRSSLTQTGLTDQTRARIADRFGGFDPDMLQPVLMRKMMLLEDRADSFRPG